MAYDCVSSCSRLLLVLASCPSLACGEVTTPGSRATTEQREEDRASEESPPGPGSRPDERPMDGGSAPDEEDETSCEPVTVAGLSVTIGSPDFECEDLRVIATAADFAEELACSVRDDRCRCFGVHERPGAYRVTVETGDPPVELVQSREIVVELDEANCHVQTELLSIRVVAPEGPDAGVADAGGEEVEPDPVVPDAGG
jgi:hypothetical protein